MARHAEIVGGGIGGLGIGMMLARYGWSVRIHERATAIREIGAGISLRNNCLEVLERFGVFPRLEPHGTKIVIEHHFNRAGQFTQSRDLSGHHRTHVFPRQALVDALATSARQAGAEIVTGSAIVSADPAGAIVDETGRRYEGDLIIAADGVHSKIREGLDFGATRRVLDTFINRYLLDSQVFTVANTMHEHWSADRRVGIMPSGNGKSFVYTVMSAKDQFACEIPLNIENWHATFPTLRDVFEVLGNTETTQYAYPLVFSNRWSLGKIALIGDAAHAMPPSLGQGAGLTLMNSHALAEVVSAGSDVEESLKRWEQHVRFLSDITQRWGMRYDKFTRLWPGTLRMLRPFVIRVIGKVGFLNERMRIADRGLSATGLKFRRDLMRD